LESVADLQSMKLPMTFTLTQTLDCDALHATASGRV
jgi:hypothetical protein